ncbi:hypothetical protein RCZ02_23750 [Capnocytophaga felis]|nr:hypothetical protein RCZ02_23750 [Capnocytophaga felis]
MLDNGKSLMLALSQDTKINRPVEAREHIRRFHELFFNVAPDKKAIDTQGNKVWERELDIYCRVRKEFTSDDVANRRSGFMPFLYQGQYYDVETELAYNRFRYYDPNTGSYISRYKPYGVLPWSVCVPR